MKHLNIKIQGSVQGVGFRWQAEKAAKKFGINGFIQNQSDGSVYIEAEGEQDQLDLFLKWCRKGPLFSNIEKVEFEEAETKGYNSFKIKT